MKKILNSKVILAALALAYLPACTDLETDNSDSIITAASGTFKPVNVSDFLTSSYNDLGNYVNQDNVYSMQAHVSDEMIPPTRGTDWGDNGVWRSLDQHTWDATHSWIRGAWNQLTTHVFKCNQILASSPSAQQKAEAQFLRAFVMWQIMDFWGQVPFREVTDAADQNAKVLSRSEAFDFVVKDLTEALAGLPVGGPKFSNNRATKAAANALLARLYLNKAVYKSANAAGPYTFDAADMDKVITYCNAVAADGYALESDYFKNFTNAAGLKEPIFTTDQGNFASRWRMTLHYDQNPDGWNGFTTLAEFYDKFETADQRKGKPALKNGTEASGIGKGFLLGQQYADNGTAIIEKRSNTPLVFTRDVTLSGAGTQKGIRVIKYHPADKGEYIFLRYADVHLMKAEAQLRKNDAAGALVTVNALRAARGASAVTAVTAESLLDERGRELYWEGIRRTDLVRFGKYTSSAGVVNTGSHTVLYPIPSNAITSNPNLKQNSGY